MKRVALFLVVLATAAPAQAQNWLFRGSHGSEAGAVDWDCGSALNQVSGLVTRQWVWSGSTAGAYEFKVETSACDWSVAYGGGTACATGAVCSLPSGGGNATWSASGGKTYTVNARQNGGNVDVAIWETAGAAANILSVAQNTPAGTVDPGTPVTIRVTTQALPGDQVVYVRWTADGWTSSTIVKAANTSATLHDAVIAVPAFADAKEGNDIAYYAFVSAKTDLDVNPIDPDLAFLTINTNGGVNYALNVYNLANAWHHPDWAEPTGVLTMRNPKDVDASDANVTIYNGIQFQGVGRSSNQTLLKLHYKKGAAGWAVLQTQDTDVFFDKEEGNNKYWRAVLPGPFTAGQDVRYVLEIDCSDRDPTYLFGGVAGTNTLTGDLATAKSLAPAVNPWSFSVQVVLGAGYHTPSASEPAGQTMRKPLAPDARVDPSVKVWFAEPDASANDPVTFVKVFYSFDGSTWTDSGNLTTITLDDQGGKDYYSYDIPIADKKDGTILRYYFFVQYDAVALDSYFYWDGSASAVTQTEATAKAGAFSVVLAGAPIPTLSEWAMIVALFLMAAVAWREIRRRGFHTAA